MVKMKSAAWVLAMTLFCSLTAMAAEKDIFGPEVFDVKERYGKQNKYTRTFQASEDLYLIKIQNGESAAGRTDSLELTVNGEKILREDRYGFGAIACFVKLKKDNTFEVNVKDDKPSGFRRPPLPPRSVTITVMPAPARIGTGCSGIDALGRAEKHDRRRTKDQDPGWGGAGICSGKSAERSFGANRSHEKALRPEGSQRP